MTTITMLYLLGLGFLVILLSSTSIVHAAEPRSHLPPLHASPSVDHGPVQVSCYYQPPSGEEPPAPLIKTQDYREAKKLILIGDKVDAPMDFSRDETKGYRVPKVWENGGCVIVLHGVDQVDKSAVDTFSLALVAHVAEKIIVDCVEGPSAHIGEEAKLGPLEIFGIIVAGVVRDASHFAWNMSYARNKSSIPSVKKS